MVMYGGGSRGPFSGFLLAAALLDQRGFYVKGSHESKPQLLFPK